MAGRAPSGTQERLAGGQPNHRVRETRDEEAGHDVEHVVVAGRHHGYRDERPPHQRQRSGPAGPEGRLGRDPDGEREADVEARHGRVRVVEDGGVAGQRYRGVVADGVGQAHAGEARRRDREDREERHRHEPRRDDGVAQPAVDPRRAPVQPDERGRQHDELRGEVDVRQHPFRQAGLERPLHRTLERDMRGALQVDDPAGVRGGGGEAAGEHPARGVIEQVDDREHEQLVAPAVMARAVGEPFALGTDQPPAGWVTPRNGPLAAPSGAHPGG